MKSKEYRTITAKTAEELDKRVNEAIREGLKLYGNPYALYLSHDPTSGITLFFQAVTAPDL